MCFVWLSHMLELVSVLIYAYNFYLFVHFCLVDFYSDVMLICFFLFFFFFFQAEDGIRDADVTGVQTCALPISIELGLAVHSVLAGETLDSPEANELAGRFRSSDLGRRAEAATRIEREFDFLRSEERRVGKECRYRGSRDN